MLIWWYSFLDYFLPFDFLKYDFIKNALLAVILVTPVFGLLGTMIVNNKMAFFSDALGHSALTGIGIGVVIGVAQPVWIMVLFSIFFAIGIVIFRYKSKAAMDTTIGVFSSTAVALGIVLLSSNGGFNKYSAFLIGDLLSITEQEIYMLIVLLALVLLVWGLIFNKLVVSSTSSIIASSRKINSTMMECIFTVVIAIAVALSIKWVGLLIINSLLVLPAAAARSIAKNIRQYSWLSVLISLICGLLGLFTAFFINTSVGATIVLYCAFVYFSLLIVNNIKNG